MVGDRDRGAGLRWLVVVLLAGIALRFSDDWTQWLNGAIALWAIGVWWWEGR